MATLAQLSVFSRKYSLKTRSLHSSLILSRLLYPPVLFLGSNWSERGRRAVMVARRRMGLVIAMSHLVTMQTQV